MTFANDRFDVATSTEMFQHTPDDAAGCREIYQVLKLGGLLVDTVPLSAAAQTIERVALTANGVVYLLPPEYHGNRLRGANKVLCYRNYGQDIVARVAAAGFRNVRFYDGHGGTKSKQTPWFGYWRVALAAQKNA